MANDLSPNPFACLDKSRFPKADKLRRRPAPAVQPAGGARFPAANDGSDDAGLFLEAVSNAAFAQPQKENLSRLPAEQEAGHDTARGAGRPAGTPPPAAPQTATQVAAKAFPMEEDAALFAAAVHGAVPVKARGRDLAAAPAPQAAQPQKPAQDLETFLAGTVEFALEYSDEFIEGHVLNLDPLVLGRLKAGQYSPESHLDLHGQNMEQAYASLVCFIKAAYQGGKRQVLVITGRGKNSPGGDAVLRERIQAWLTRDPFKRVVLAFCTAQPKDGGAGALYLLLRKRRKNQGKIIWDRAASAEELLL